jgi:hypothetical protein
MKKVNKYLTKILEIELVVKETSNIKDVHIYLFANPRSGSRPKRAETAAGPPGSRFLPLAFMAALCKWALES